jgi:hypothetical protein
MAKISKVLPTGFATGTVLRNILGDDTDRITIGTGGEISISMDAYSMGVYMEPSRIK